MKAAAIEACSTWRFHPMDTLFFRESRPHSPVGAAILSSVFPPSPRTVAGAVRFLIGERLGVDWRRLGKGGGGSAEERFRNQVGDGKGYGKLRVAGPWLALRRRGEGWQRLFPAPRNLAYRGRKADEVELQGFTLGKPVVSDLGTMRLPRLPSGAARRFQGVEDGWLTAAGWEAWLRGEAPSGKEWIRPDTLVREEPRMGIVRDPRRGSAVKGLLYQTRHLRLPAALRSAEEVAVEVGLGGIDADLLTPALPALRLGGEGRLATVEKVEAALPFLPSPAPGATARGLVLYLLTPADLEGHPLLPRRGSEGAWRLDLTGHRAGHLAGHRITVHSAILGKPLREGGWDLAKNAPREVRTLVPAGSAWYCTVELDGHPLRGADLAAAIEDLHGHHIGRETALGRGCLAVGLWDESRHEETDTETETPKETAS